MAAAGGLAAPPALAGSTSTAVESALNPSALGESVTFTATVAGGGPPGGDVTFADGSTTIGTGSLDRVGHGAPLAPGLYHSCFLTAAGGVQCVGDDGDTQLGDAASGDKLTPIDVSGLVSGVRGIDSYDRHTCALLDDGSVRCWGLNEYRQTGAPSGFYQATPVTVDGLGGPATIVVTGEAFSCAALEAGGVKCWGGGDVGAGATPVAISNLSERVVALAAGSDHACAVTEQGAVKCWGDNSAGQLGDGNKPDDSEAATIVTGLGGPARDVAAGAFHSCAVFVAGGVACWGSNDYGQLGDGTKTDRPAPVVVSGPLTGIVAVDAGYAHTCALSHSGAVSCWGDDSVNQLGNGAASGSTVPVAPTGLTAGVAVLAAGNLHSCVLMQDGSARCWGYNSDGQAGTGDTGAVGEPVAAGGYIAGALRGYSVATIATAELSGGSHAITATYPGSAGQDPSVSAVLNQVVNKAASSVAIGSSAAATVFGEAVTFTATVSSAAGTPSGDVTFRAGATSLGTVALNGGGVATLGVTALAVGGHSISAEYAGNISFTGSTSSAIAHTVGKGATDADIAVSSTTVEEGDPVTLTATISAVAPANGVPDGSVTFRSGGSDLGTAALAGGKAKLDVTLPIGTHIVTAGYTGSADWTGATSAGLSVTVSKVSLPPAEPGPEFGINPDKTEAQDQPAVAALPKGYVVLWRAESRTSTQTDIRGRLLKPNGKPRRKDFLVSAATSKGDDDPAVAGLRNGAFVAVWASDGVDGSGSAVVAQRFNNKGRRRGKPVQANSRAKKNQAMPTVASLPNGTFVTAWASKKQDGSGWGVFAQAFKATGVMNGREIRLNATTKKNQAAPALCALGHNGYVAAWESKAQDGSGYGIVARLLKKTGKPRGGEIMVNVTTAGHQRQPALAALYNGGFVAAWASRGQDGSGWGVYARRFRSNGKPVGGEIAVAETTAGDQTTPAVIGLENGGFAVVWVSEGQDGSGDGVYGRLFDADGAASSSEFPLNQTTKGDQSEPGIAVYRNDLLSVWTTEGLGKANDAVSGATVAVE